MTSRLALAISFMLVVFLSCSKSDNTNNGNHNITGQLFDFTVTVTERSPGFAVIVWDSCVNTINNDTVKYRVLLSDAMVNNNLTVRTDTLLNLVKGQAYNGKVIAYINHGDSLIAEFTIPKYEGYIFVNTENGNESTYGCFSAYPEIGVPMPQPIWRFSTTGYLSYPTIVNDTFFISTNSGLKAMNAMTGSTYWENASFKTPVTYSNGRLYGYRGDFLVAINAADGQLIWQYNDNGNPAFQTVNSTPVIDGDKVFVATTNYSQGETHAVNAVTGQKIWNIQYGDLGLNGRPLAADGKLVFISALWGRAFALDQNTGAEVWSMGGLGIIGVNFFDPVYFDKKVLIQTTGDIYALDIANGGIKWQHPNSGSFTEGVAGNGKIYFCQDTVSANATYDKVISCLDAKDGRFVWRFYAHSPISVSNLVFARDKIYLASRSIYMGSATALNSYDGTSSFRNYNSNLAATTLGQQITYMILKKDGIISYPSHHGNYR